MALVNRILALLLLGKSNSAKIAEILFNRSGGDTVVSYIGFDTPHTAVTR